MQLMSNVDMSSKEARMSLCVSYMKCM